MENELDLWSLGDKNPPISQKLEERFIELLKKVEIFTNGKLDAFC